MSPGDLSGPTRQRGIAIITAMLVVTIATILAVELAWQTNLDLRRTEGLLTWDQAHQFGYGAEAFAAKLMEEKLQNQADETSAYLGADDEKACQGFQFAIEQGGMTGGVCDLQGRFNLNNLSKAGKRDELAVKQYRRLLNAISALSEDIDIEADVIEVIVESTVDWIDTDSDAEFNGAESDAYTSLQPPYRAANLWFTSVSELRAVRGVTPEIYLALKPFVAALPVAAGKLTLVNVNTASMPVLMSLGDDINAANAEEWLTADFENNQQIQEKLAGFVDPLMFPYLGVSTDFFELTGLVSIGTTRLGMYSLLENTGQAVVPRLRQFDVVDAVPAEDAAEPIEGENVVETDE